MPPPRKIDLMPADLRNWLQDELVARGFGDYHAVTEALNFRLEERGEELRIGKSAVHAYGSEYQAFVKYQEQANAWAADWLKGEGIEDAANRHHVLFQMVSTLAFKLMASQMEKDADEIDPKNLHFIGKMLKDIMSSAGIREKLVADERLRIEKEAKAEAAATAVTAARAAGLSVEGAERIKAQILGVA